MAVSMMHCNICSALLCQATTDVSVCVVAACEFSLLLGPGSGSQGDGHLVVQAPTLELKSTWTHVLQQRICACKAQLVLENNLDNIV